MTLSSPILDSCVLGEFNPLKTVRAAPLFTFSAGTHEIVVSNHMFMITLATVILLLLLFASLRSPKLIPKGIQNLIEMICVYLREQMARPVLGESTDQFICFIWTIFNMSKPRKARRIPKGFLRAKER